MSGNLETSVKTKQHLTHGIGYKVRNIFTMLLLSFLGSTVIVFATDHYLLLSDRMEAEPKWAQLGVVETSTETVWSIGVKLPGGMAFERVYSTLPGAQSPALAFGYWDFKILPTGLVLNSLIVAGPLCVLLTIVWWGTARVIRSIKTKSRRARGQCEVCAYLLIAGQNPCPECGHHRKLINYKAANCGNVQS